MAAYGLYTHIQSNKRRSIALLVCLFFLVYLLVYAAGIWRMRRFTVAMGGAYAAYVILNLVLFTVRTPAPPGAGAGWYVFGVVYAAVAIAVSVGTWRTLARRRADLV